MPPHSLVWRLLNPATHQVPDSSSGRAWVDATWAFVLRNLDAHNSRLIQRFRFGIRPGVLGPLYTALMEVPHFVMERRMLLGIRERAERDYASGAIWNHIKVSNLSMIPRSIAALSAQTLSPMSSRSNETSSGLGVSQLADC